MTTTKSINTPTIDASIVQTSSATMPVVIDTNSIHVRDGVKIFKRAGTYYARITVGPSKYKDKTLKTGNLEQARELAIEEYYKLKAAIAHGLPVDDRRFKDIITEYVDFRTTQNKHGDTSRAMLRQIERISKYISAYVANKTISQINDNVIKQYPTWRKDYYTKHAKHPKHRNARLVPTDKTIEYECTIFRSIIIYAHNRGYRGVMALPTARFKAKTKRVRPAFELPDYKRLLNALRSWIRECNVPAYRYVRELLLDYVLILANSGIRVGEANNLLIRDVIPFYDHMYDEHGQKHRRKVYRLIVRGKTGEREVIPRAATTKYIDRLLARKPDANHDDYFFTMRNGTKVITLIDQFNKVLERADMLTNSAGKKYTLYSLRHYYAVWAIRKNDVNHLIIAQNMGTTVQMIKEYYGRQATPKSVASKLAGKWYQDIKPITAPESDDL